MLTFAKRLAQATLCGTVALGILVPAAQAQRRGGMMAHNVPVQRPAVYHPAVAGAAGRSMGPSRPIGTRPAAKSSRGPVALAKPALRNGPAAKPKPKPPPTPPPSTTPPGGDPGRDRGDWDRGRDRERGEWAHHGWHRPWWVHPWHHQRDRRDENPANPTTVTNNNNNNTSTGESMGTMGTTGADYGPLFAYELLRRDGTERRRYEREEKDEGTPRGGSPSAQRGWNRAPVTKIVSGEALNHMLDQFSSLQGKGYSPPLVVLDRDVSERINVATVSGGNPGLLKNKGQLDWPRSLQGSEFEEERTVLNEAAEEAFKQAVSRSHVGRDVLISLDGGIDQLEAKLKGQVSVLPPSEYIEAKRFVRQLVDASRALKQPDAASYFNRTYAAKGRTVEQLVKNMTAQELRFAPATPGTEQAYLKLYRALALCTVAIQEDFGQD